MSRVLTSMRENTSPENMSDPNTRKEFVEALARVI
jgi:hypothetical protein